MSYLAYTKISNIFSVVVTCLDGGWQCLNGGTCLNPGNACACMPGFTGAFCETGKYNLLK